MSYSFSARGKNDAALAAAVVAEFDTIVAVQPIHAKDREPVQIALQLLAQTIDLETGKELAASISGSVYSTGERSVRSVSVSINISQAEPAPAPT